MLERNTHIHTKLFNSKGLGFFLHLEHKPDEDQGPDGVTHIIAAVGEGGGAGRDHLKQEPVLCTVSVQ